jgi:hypothetical protein
MTNYDQSSYHDDYQPSSDRGKRGRGGYQSRPNPSQDIRYMQQTSPPQESYDQDFPTLGGGRPSGRGGYGRDDRPSSRGGRGQGDSRTKISPRYEHIFTKNCNF